MTDIIVSAAPVEKFTRTCDKCGHALTYTHEHTRAHHRGPDGAPCEPEGRYLDCPRQTCRHPNQVPDIAAKVPAAVAAPVPVVAAESAPVLTVDDPTKRDCACVSSVRVAGDSRLWVGGPGWSRFAMRADPDRPNHYRACFARIGCVTCSGLGRVAQ